MTSRLSPDRKGKIGSSHVAALFGASPYMTRLQLYAHFKAGLDIDGDTDNERMYWGRALQDDILEAVVRKTGWTLEENPNRWLDHPEPELRTGATVDAWIRAHDRGLGICEIKNVDRQVWMQGWSEDSAPDHIELQLQHQLLISGAQWGVIAALVGGNELMMVPDSGYRRPIPEVHAAIEREIRQFWSDVEQGRPPEPVGRAEEIRAMAELWPRPIPEPVFDKSDDNEAATLVRDLDWATSKRKQANDYYDRARTRVLSLMGPWAQMRVQGAFVSVTRSEVEEREIKRRASTQTRVYVKRIKGEEFPAEEI